MYARVLFFMKTEKAVKRQRFTRFKKRETLVLFSFEVDK